jgi:F-type H+-transporting ATPase subunit delta
VPLGAKQNLMRELLALQPGSKVVARLMTLIVENDDVNELAVILEEFEQRVLELHQVVKAEITSAVPLPADKLQAIEASLAAAAGSRVVITPKVDPAILGGVVAKVGSRVYDGSVARHLERIRARLVAGEQLL